MEVRVEDFAEKLSAKFMDEQSDAWVLGLYQFLQEGRGQLYSNFTSRALIRLESGKHVAPFAGNSATPNAYLPTEADSELPTVKRSLCKDTQIVEFLRELGLSTPDIVDEVIETVLPRYADGKSVEIKVWKNDFRKILGALEGTGSKRYRLLEALKGKAWVLVQLAEKGLCLASPDSAYVPSDELKLYFGSNGEARFLAKDYYSDRQVEVLVALGVARSPRLNVRQASYEGNVTLANYHGLHKRGLAGFDPEWRVDGLEEALTDPDLEVSAFVWNRIAVLHAHLIRGVIEFSSRKTFASSQRKEKWSSTGEFLRDTAWLPDRDGGFHKPAQLLLSELPPQFDRESAQAKHLAEALAMRQPETVKAIDALAGSNDRLKGIIERLTQGDLDDDFLDRLEKFFPRTEPAKPPTTFRDAVQAIHRNQRSQEGDGDGPRAGIVQNPQRYEKKLREDIDH